MPTKRQRVCAQRQPRKNVLPPDVVRPQAKNLKRVVEYLEAIGLAVYGNNHDLKTGDRRLGHRDYDPQDVITYRRRWHNNTLGYYPVDLED
jgi:hypothetical protein